MDSDQRAPFAFGSTAIYHCDQGFHLSGDSELSCSHGIGTVGRWNGTEPSCDCKSNKWVLECSITNFLHKNLYLAILCEDLPNFENGKILYEMDADESPPYDYGTRAIYSCIEGFSPEGNYTTRICGDGDTIIGKWNGTEPLCQRKPT